MSEKNWCRISSDVTHYNGNSYLTLVDCGPSRFAIWRRIKNEDTACIKCEIEQIFRERGPPAELLMDNGTAFRSGAMRDFLARWNVKPVYRCAYRPAGNGVVERNHRTIKRMAARSNADPLDMVHWYNRTPKEGIDANSVPAQQIYSYDWRQTHTLPETENTDWSVGDSVFVKPPNCRCTSLWPEGTITAVQSPQKVEVNGVPRHIADIRAAPPKELPTNQDVVEEEEKPNAGEPIVPRVRKPPDRFGNNIYDT